MHPLVERSEQREVRKASDFRLCAQALTGAQLADEFQQECASAPSRSSGGRKHLLAPNRRLAAERGGARRDCEHAAIALVQRQKQTERGLLLPEDIGAFDALHAGAVLKSGVPDRKLGAADPNYGINKVDVVGIGQGDRLALGFLRFLAPGAQRISPGDTPLRALLEAMAQCAVAKANRDVLLAELAPRSQRTFAADAPPVLMLIGSQRYWELSRRREAHKGAGWIRELSRLAEEFEAASGVTVMYLALRVNGDPGWQYDTGAPVFEGDVRLLPAWEYGAGQPKPRPRSSRRRRSAAELAAMPVAADLERPVRSYDFNAFYTAGDRIEHPTLGVGVVQGLAGPGKIRVLFENKKNVLVHDRARQATPTAG